MRITFTPAFIEMAEEAALCIEWLLIGLWLGYLIRKRKVKK